MFGQERIKALEAEIAGKDAVIKQLKDQNHNLLSIIENTLLYNTQQAFVVQECVEAVYDKVQQVTRPMIMMAPPDDAEFS